MTPKQLYEEKRLKWYAANRPHAVASNLVPAVKFPKVETANGLTTYCIDILNWDGHHAERTNNMGVARKKSHQRFDIFTGKTYEVTTGIEYTKGGGVNGTTDIKGHFISPNHKFPIPIYIEIKAGKDRVSDDQKEYEQKVTSTGALHCYVRKPEDFVSFYNYLCTL